MAHSGFLGCSSNWRTGGNCKRQRLLVVAQVPGHNRKKGSECLDKVWASHRFQGVLENYVQKLGGWASYIWLDMRHCRVHEEDYGSYVQIEETRLGFGAFLKQRSNFFSNLLRWVVNERHDTWKNLLVKWWVWRKLQQNRLQNFLSGCARMVFCQRKLVKKVFFVIFIGLLGDGLVGKRDGFGHKRSICVIIGLCLCLTHP